MYLDAQTARRRHQQNHHLHKRSPGQGNQIHHKRFSASTQNWENWTETGKSRIVKETEEDSFYITQVLNILGKDVLTLYDSGASHSLIRGDLGEDLGMKVVSDEFVSIRTAGGGKIRTEYGSYKASLGPTDDGTYQEITAQGINTVTSKFKKYSLSEVN